MGKIFKESIKRNIIVQYHTKQINPTSQLCKTNQSDFHTITSTTGSFDNFTSTTKL